MKVIPWDGKPISKPGIYSGVPMDVYHGPNLCVGPSVSSSVLRTVFTQSPLDAWIYSSLNPNRLEPPEKEAFVLGRAAHHVVLGEADFQRHFIIEPETYPDEKTGKDKPWHNGSGYCKRWAIDAKDALIQPVTRKQLLSIQGMAGVLPWQAGLEDCGLANTALVQAGALRGLIEHTIIGYDEETGLWLKSRPDVIPTDSLDFNDFKTTVDVANRAIQRTLDDYRYDMQADLASVCLEQAQGVRFESFGFIFAAKKPPHATNVIELVAEDLRDAADDNRVAMRTFARCLDTGKWSGPAGQRGDATFLKRSETSRLRAADRRAYLELELAA